MGTIRIGIAGGAGYTGGELLRILINHPQVEICWVHSNSNAGKPLSDVHSDLFGDTDLKFTDSISQDIDVLFLGQKYGNRARLISRLRSRGFKVVTAGNGWPEGFADFDKSLELVNRAKVVLGIGDVGYLSSVQHLKGRDFEIPMCGAVYLTTYNPELADWFEIGREILCYDSPQDCEEILRGLLNNPDKQRELRNAAVARSLKDHTWEHRIAKLFGLMRTE